MSAQTEGIIYHVYGRRAHTEPLSFVQAVLVAAQEELSPGLLEDKDSEWVELIAFPASSVVQVIPGEESDD